MAPYTLSSGDPKLIWKDNIYIFDACIQFRRGARF